MIAQEDMDSVRHTQTDNQGKHDNIGKIEWDPDDNPGRRREAGRHDQRKKD